MKELCRLLFLFLLALRCAGENNYADYAEYAYYNYTGVVSNCPDAFIEVSSVSILCDSPYTFYYGNGAHRNSRYCDYGDKATITISFNVTSSLNDGTDIYMTLGIYAAQSQSSLVYSKRAVELCNNYVGYSCTSRGGYSFSFRSKFDYLYSDASEFIPIFEIGFSSQPDEGYNLGGANINCGYNNENAEVQEYDTWMNGDNAAQVKTRASGTFASNYGILLGVAALLLVFFAFAWKKSEDNQVEYRGNQMGLIGIDHQLRAID